MRLGQGAVSQVPGFLENSCLKQEEGEKEEEEKMELLSLPAGAGDQAWRVTASLDWSPGASIGNCISLLVRRDPTRLANSFT